METLVVIPARMASSRFPGKPLAKIAGKEMILHVLERLPNYHAIVATPDEIIYDFVRRLGYEAFLTRTPCATGTDRLVEVARYIHADIYINVQGDEPLIDQHDVLALDKMKKVCYEYVIGAVCQFDTSCNDVKVMLDGNDLTDMSRTVYRQRGIYALNGEDLRLYGQAKNTEKENIEITRFLGLRPIKMVMVNDTPDVNVPEDIKTIEGLLCQKK